MVSFMVDVSLLIFFKLLSSSLGIRSLVLALKELESDGGIKASLFSSCSYVWKIGFDTELNQGVAWLNVSVGVNELLYTFMFLINGSSWAILCSEFLLESLCLSPDEDFARKVNNFGLQITEVVFKVKFYKYK